MTRNREPLPPEPAAAAPLPEPVAGDSGAGDSLLQRQPVLVQLLGLSPMLVLATSLHRALAFALLSAFVYLFTTVTLTLARNPMNASWRYLFYLSVLALYTTLAERLAFYLLPELHAALGVYVFLITCNFAILTQLESSAESRSWAATMTRSAGLILAYTLTLLAFAVLREMLLTGGVSLDWQLFSMRAEPDFSVAAESPGNGLLAAPAMGLLLLGLLAAAWNWLALRWPARRSGHEVSPVERARVTGKLHSRKTK